MTFEIPTNADIERIVKQAVQDSIENTVPEILAGSLKEDWITTEELLKRTGWSSSVLHAMKKKGLLPYSQEKKRGTIHWPWRRICKEYFEANLVEPEG